MPHLIPKAFRWELHFCGHCPNGHLLVYDEANQPMCDFTITADQAEWLAYRIRSENGGEVKKTPS